MQRVLSFPPPRSFGDSRGYGDTREFISKRMCFAFMFTLGFLAFLGGFLLGRFVFDKELEQSRIKLKEAKSQKGQVFGVYKNYSQFSAANLIEGLSEEYIQKYLWLLKNQTGYPDENFREAKIVREHLISHGFDIVSPLINSQVHLSYPSAKHPNEAKIMDSSGSLKISDIREKYFENEEEEVDSVIVEGPVSFLNFGRNEDYQYLDTMGISYVNKIILMKAGRISTTEMVSNAIDHGASGILVYVDPEYKTDIELPLVKATDLAKLQMRYGNHIDKWKGTIPILEISSDDAANIIQRMDIINNRRIPKSWKTTLGIKNNSFSAVDGSITIQMKVNTVNSVKTYYNILGAMRGIQEPDRFMMLTNEKNLKNTEKISTSIIMEIIRALGDLKIKGWRPHRSVVVAFWDVEGPSSYPTSVLSHIFEKAVAYLNVQSVYISEDNRTFAKVAPVLEKLFYESAHTNSIKNLSADIFPILNTDNLFIQCGIPYIKVEQYNAKTLKDIASFWGKITWEIFESYKLPFSLNSYTNFFSHSIDAIEKKFKTIPKKNSLYLDSLIQQVQQLKNSIKSFDEKWSRLDKSKSIEMRIMTDQLLDFNRFLLCDSDSTATNNLSRGNSIFSRALVENDEKIGFGELQNLLHDFSSSDYFNERMVTHLADLVDTINLARDALSDGLDIIVMKNT